MKQSIDPSYGVLAARNIRKQAKALLRQIEGTRTGEDVECLHQARVASRRLRAALSTFRDCWPGRTFRKWRKQIRQFTVALGSARDMDVQVQYIQQILAELPEERRPCRAGVARLLLRLRQRREALQPRVIRGLDRLEGSGALKEIRSVTDQVLAGQEDGVAFAPSPFAFAQARENIVRRLYKLMGYQGSLADPADRRRHHRMRVSAKRLRYTMELFKPVYQDTVDETVTAVKQVQTLLGAIHDSDVWTEDFQRFRDEEQERARQYFGHSRPFKRLAPGIDYLLEHQQEVRQQAFAELKRRWGEIQDAQIWERLIQTLDSHIDKAEQGEEPGGEAQEDCASEQAAS
ncbi:MAG TPA: CHAD domain-containing protein [Phycisphaerae bacterium]|nr:CHAD domain-containing protein [Phycisphaerae bacterium]